MEKKQDGFFTQAKRLLTQDLWRLEPTSLSKARRRGLHLLRVCALVVKGFKEDKCPLHAAALTFSFVMALIPSLVIALSFAKAFGMEGLQNTVLDALTPPPAMEQSIDGHPVAEAQPAADSEAEPEANVAPDSEAGPDAEAGIWQTPDGSSEDPISSYLVKSIHQMPDEGKQVVRKILQTVENASAGAIGGFGAVIFLYILIKMLSQTEETFNTVWGVQTSRTMMDKVRNYVFIMAVTPLFLILGTTAGPTVIAIGAKLEWALGPFSQLLTFAVPVLLMALGFCIFYMFLPNTKVAFSAAFTGALISSVLVVLLQTAMIKLGFGVSKYNKIYGALAAIPIFLFWVQMSWMILLMGAEVAFSVQNAGTYARERLAVTPSARARLCLAITLMKHITEKFESVNPPFDVIAYGIDKRIPVRLINDVINILATAGLVAESSEHPRCYTLLQNPRSITARCIIDAVLDAGAAPSELGLAAEFPMFGKITDESFQSLENQLLENF